MIFSADWCDDPSCIDCNDFDPIDFSDLVEEGEEDW